MSKYIGPKLKFSRREGTDLFLKSSIRTLDTKCKIDRLPGQHIYKKVRITDYGLQLREKQKVKRIYGILEKQFSNYYYKALKSKGNTGEILLKLLERRLDNVVYRMGFAVTRAEARQLVSHKSIIVNNKIVNIPSYLVNINDIIKIHNNSKNQNRIKYSLELKNKEIPSWVEVNINKMEGIFKFIPERSMILFDIKEYLILEYYSK